MGVRSCVCLREGSCGDGWKGSKGTAAFYGVTLGDLLCANLQLDLRDLHTQ